MIFDNQIDRHSQIKKLGSVKKEYLVPGYLGVKAAKLTTGIKYACTEAISIGKQQRIHVNIFPILFDQIHDVGTSPVDSFSQVIRQPVA